MRRQVVRWILALALLAPRGAGAAGAEVRTASLSWVRRPGSEMCPGPSAMARSVERRLGHPVFVPPARADLSVEAYVEHADAGWHVVISLSGTDEVVGHRDLVDQEPSCDHIAESAVLAVALMIDPDAVLRPEPPAPVPAAPPEPAQERPSAPAPTLPWHGSAEIAAGVATGLLPELAPGVFVRGRATLPSRLWAFELEGAYFFQQSVTVQERAPANEEARFAMLYGGLSLCWSPQLAPAIGALACAGGDVGAIASSGNNFDVSQTMKQSLLMNLVGKGRLSFRVAERWLLLVGGDFFVPLWRDRFLANPGGTGDREIFRLPVVAGAFELGIALDF